MSKRKMISGFQRKYLEYTIGLLILALCLSAIFVGIYMRQGQQAIITDKFSFYNEKAGISLDRLFQDAKSGTEECIFNDLVQQSLTNRGLTEVQKSSLSKYFAYVDLDQVADYCYVDNKNNMYIRAYSKLTAENFERSGMVERLGDSYADTVWFMAEDTLFGSGELSLFIGRKVHSLEYSHEPGYLFLKMDPGFLNSIFEDAEEYASEVVSGVIDSEGNFCTVKAPEGVDMSKVSGKQMLELADSNGTGQIVDSADMNGGKLSLYRQAEGDFYVFTWIPEKVLYSGAKQLLMVLLAIYATIIVVGVISSVASSGKFTEPVKIINSAMTEFDGNDFSHKIHLNTNTELDHIGNSYNEMLDNIEHLLAEIKIQQEELRTSEMNMLISQINPHFLYNTLDTIYMLARINKEETTMNMIQALSKYLRLSLSKGKDVVTVADELENVKSYLQIQQIRNDQLFTYEIECEVDAEHTSMIKLVLQPLVENAIKYGFNEIYEGGVIRIHVWKEEDMLMLEVYNNGTPIDPQVAEVINSLKDHPISEIRNALPHEKNGYGVINVFTRLHLKYGDRAIYTYTPEEDGTTCLVGIPLESEQQGKEQNHEENQ